MDWLLALAAGALQGVFEWLPVSSTGQAVLFLSAAGIANPYSASLALHLGTGLAAVLRYRFMLAKALRSPRSSEALALVVPLAIGSPIALALHRVGASLEAAGRLTLLVGVLLVVTGLLLLATWRGRKPSGSSERGPSLADLVAVGALQGVAVLPGLSRSAVVTAYLALRLGDPLTAVSYAFYTGITAQLAAGLYGVASLGSDLALVALGVAAATATGYLAITAVEAIAIAVRRALPPFLLAYGVLVIALNLVYPGHQG